MKIYWIQTFEDFRERASGGGESLEIFRSLRSSKSNVETRGELYEMRGTALGQAALANAWTCCSGARYPSTQEGETTGFLSMTEKKVRINAGNTNKAGASG